MKPADEERAHRLGQRLGTWAWGATVAGVRSAIVIALLAAFWNAVDPGVAFGAWAAVFAAVSVLARACKLVTAIVRQRLRFGRTAGHGRAPDPLQRN